MERAIATVIAKQDRFFPKAGLGNPTIPTGAAARTLVRYQASINAMLFRCLNFLERRRKERMASGETSEELDYINEPTEPPTSSTETKPEAPTVEVSGEKPAEPANDAEMHERTQKDATDAPVSSNADVKSHDEPLRSIAGCGPVSTRSALIRQMAPVWRSASYTTIDTALERLRLRTPGSKIGMVKVCSRCLAMKSRPSPLVSLPNTRKSPA